MDNDSNDYISKNEFFMMSAILASKRSKDPSTKVGAIVVNNDNDRIIGSGYNGFPNGIKDSDLPWTKDSSKFEETKYAYVVHAEANCLVNANSNNLQGHTMYVTLFPCSSCTKLIIQKGIKKIVFLKLPNLKNKEKESDFIASTRMLDLAKIVKEKYIN